MATHVVPYVCHTCSISGPFMLSVFHLCPICAIHVPFMFQPCAIYVPFMGHWEFVYVPSLFHVCSISVPSVCPSYVQLCSPYVRFIFCVWSQGRSPGPPTPPRPQPHPAAGPGPGPWHQKRNRSRTEMEHRWTQNGTYMEHRWNRLGKCNINIKTSLLVTENPISYHLINHSARCSNIPPRRLLGCGLCC
jgi:hypothetical protein